MGDHWYDRCGVPAYEIVGTNGTHRPTTLRDARTLGLVPSVTTVLSVIAKPSLERWKIRQAVLAALTLPKIQGETDDAWLDRIDRDSVQQVVDAADEGTRIHDSIEASFKGLHFHKKYYPHLKAAHDALSETFPGVTDWVAERSFANELGYGGKIDLHSPSTGIVVDWKGKDGDFTDKKRLAYDQHWQLAAYRDGLRLPRNVCANGFVSRTHPGRICMHVWTADQIDAGGLVFRRALELWKAIKGFDPAF
jgi:hypothetical protein